MSGSMSAQLAVQRFPSAQFLHGHIPTFTSGKYACIGAETMQQTVYIDRNHPDRITHHLAEAAWQQPDILQIKTFQLNRGHRFLLHLPCMLPGIDGLCRQRTAHAEAHRCNNNLISHRFFV